MKLMQQEGTEWDIYAINLTTVRAEKSVTNTYFITSNLWI